MRGDWLRARELYDRLDPHAASLPPDVLYYRRGEIAEVLGRDEEACAAFAESVRLYPGSRQALTALSRTALRIGDLPRAIEASRALLDLIPPDDVRAVRAARLQLAELCAAQRRQRGRAIAYYEQVLADEPQVDHRAVEPARRCTARRATTRPAARVLRSLIALTPAPAQRAELLYRLGELCRRGLGDSGPGRRLLPQGDRPRSGSPADPAPPARVLLAHRRPEEPARRGARPGQARRPASTAAMDADALAGAMLIAGAARRASRWPRASADYFGRRARRGPGRARWSRRRARERRTARPATWSAPRSSSGRAAGIDPAELGGRAPALRRRRPARRRAPGRRLGRARAS